MTLTEQVLEHIAETDGWRVGLWGGEIGTALRRDGRCGFPVCPLASMGELAMTSDRDLTAEEMTIMASADFPFARPSRLPYAAHFDPELRREMLRRARLVE